MIKVLVVDDHPTTKMGLNLLLESTLDISVIGEAECGIKALELVSTLKPEILLLDYKLPDLSGPEVSAEIQKINTKTRVLGYSAYSDEICVTKMLDAGAQGYVLKTESPILLLEAIRAVAKGEFRISQTVANLLLNRPRKDSTNPSFLTQRELQVLKLLAKGYSNTQIAKALVISRATVKNHLSNIYNSLSVCSRAEAITWAWSNGLIARELPEV